MTPQHSTLRISALYHARGMISQSEYREFRARYLRAVIHGDALPELPDDWHHVPPGTHTMSEEEPPPAPQLTHALTPRAITVAIAIAVVAIGALLILLKLN